MLLSTSFVDILYNIHIIHPVYVDSLLSSYSHVCFSRSPLRGVDLAWAAFMLLRSTNACTVMVVDVEAEEAWVVRGAVGNEVADGKGKGGERERDEAGLLGRVGFATGEMVRHVTAKGARRKKKGNEDGEERGMWDWDTRRAMEEAGAKDWEALVPVGIRSMLVIPFETKAKGGGGLTLMSEQERAFSETEKRWARGTARKFAQR